METLLDLDKNIFLFFNALHHPAVDIIMWEMSRNLVWIPLYIYIFYAIYKHFGLKKMFFILLGIALCVLLADQLSVHLFKNVFQRLRPSHEPELTGMVHLVRDYRGGNWGFVSSHAANTFAIATFLSLIFKNPKFWIILFSWCIIVSYTRIYLGVHYPGDIFGGALLGMVIGWGNSKLTFFLFFRQKDVPAKPK